MYDPIIVSHNSHDNIQLFGLFILLSAYESETLKLVGMSMSLYYIT